MSSQSRDTEPSQMDEIVTSVRLPRAQHDALRLRAKAQHRTLSGELRRIIERELAQPASTPEDVAA